MGERREGAGPTPKGGPVRARMVEVTIELMRGSGLSGAGINEVVKAGQVPKGSVYHYFPGGKQQLVKEGLELHGLRMQAFIRANLAKAEAPGDKVRALFEAFAKRLEGSGFTRSCPAGTVCLDLVPELDNLRLAVSGAFAMWIGLIAEELEFTDRRRAWSFAGLVVTAIEGAYIRGRAEQTAQPFIDAGEWLALLAEQEAIG